MFMDIKVGLDAIGLQDNHHLKCALVNCDDPLIAISEFQDENSILLPTLKPALPLLDLHNVKRYDFHQSVADELKDRLLKRIEELANSRDSNDLNKLEELLDKTFPVINLSRITNLVLLIMKYIPNLNTMYLNYIKENNEYYNIAPIEVKRQIWVHNPELFSKELNPLFDKCISYFDENLYNIDIIQKSLTNGTSEDQLNNKRHSIYINDLVKMISNNGRLYYNAVNNLLKLYNNTKNWYYASIRSLLLIKLHDVHVVDMQSSENIYKFTWTLNTCIKERRIESKKAKELELIMDSKKIDKIFNDISFVLADCFAIDTLAYSSIKILSKCIQNDVLPRNCSDLLFTLRLLSLSLLAWDIIANQHITKEPKIDSTIITCFLSNLGYLMVDYYERTYEESLSILCDINIETDKMKIVSDSSLIELPSKNTTNSVYITAALSNIKTSNQKSNSIEIIKQYNQDHELCCVLILYYVLECIELNDWVNFKILLNIIRYPENFNDFEKWFLSQFITLFNDYLDCFKNDLFCNIVFDDFLLKRIKENDGIYELVYKFMDKLFGYLSTSTYLRILDEIKPKKNLSNNLHVLFTKLKSKCEIVAAI